MSRISLSGARNLARRMRYVESPVPYAVGELLRRGGVSRHTPVGSRVELALRHGSPDIAIVDEVFVKRLYEPPPAVASEVDRLGTSPRILDLGGHIGVFGAWALTRFPGAVLTSVEPDRGNAALLLRSARTSGAAWDVLTAAAGARTGFARLTALGEPGSSLSADGEQPVVVVDVLPLIAETDFLKMDIEGGEWDILEDERFAEVVPRVTVCELHDRPDGRDPYAVAAGLFESAGCQVSRIADAPVGAAMLWAWRT